MIRWLINIVAYSICAIASIAIVRWINSSVVEETLLPNLPTIVLALLAINVQTTAVIAVKLKEISDRTKYSFSKSINQFYIAFYEQGGLLLFSLALSTLSKSKTQAPDPTLTGGLSFFIFYASLHIFIDTSIGLLVALFPKTESN